MSKIFFISNDERIDTLIENLQPIIAHKITTEPGYSNALKRISQERPDVIFIQNMINGVSCSNTVQRVRTLADKETSLVLLSDQYFTPDSVTSFFDGSIDINLPLGELSRQLLQILATRPAGPDRPDPREEATELLITSLDVEELDPHLVQFSEFTDEEGLRRDSSQGQGDRWPCGSEESAGIALPDMDQAAGDIDFFLEESSPETDLVNVRDEAPEEAPFLPQHSGKLWSAEQHDSAARVRYRPDLALHPCDSSAAAGTDGEPPIGQTPLEGAIPTAGGARAVTGAVKKAGNSLYPTRDQLYRKEVKPSATDVQPPQACLKDEGSTKHRPGGGMAVCGLLLVCLAFLALPLNRSPEKADPGKETLAPQVVTTADRPRPQKRPQFIPQVAPDADYAASRPGWERYREGDLQYLVFREEGNVRAVQVISKKPEGIPISFVESFVRKATGQELAAVATSRSGNGLTLETRPLAEGSEVAIYRSSADGGIRGVVLQFPAKKPVASTVEETR